MAWFTPDAIAFFKELAENNSKAWFEPNRKRYEKSVKQPMLEFAAEMIERMRRIDPEITMLPRQAVFRLHRDTRFSQNKAPYKTNAGMVITRGAKHDPGRPGLYFHFDAERMVVASGCYFLLPPQVKTIRGFIAGHLDEFQGLLDDPGFQEAFGTVAGEKNKVLPPELKDAAARQPLIYNKQFFYWSEHPAQEITREDLPDFVMARIEAAQPMNAFLCRGLGI